MGRRPGEVAGDGRAQAGSSGPQADIDLSRANAARMYDFFLGGAHNFAVDRAQAARVIAANPHVIDGARANRSFLARAVQWCLAAGIDQFLDLGSGVPTVGNVHEIAHRHHPATRVAYVDVEPVAVAHATDLLRDLDHVTITRADLRDVERVLAAPGVADLLDLTRPVALLAVAVLHFVPEDPAELLAAYHRVLAPGSVVVLSHVSDDHDDPEFTAQARAGQSGYRGSATELVLRSRDELHRALAGLELLDPGLVDVTDWPHPDPATPTSCIYGAIAASALIRATLIRATPSPPSTGTGPAAGP